MSYKADLTKVLYMMAEIYSSKVSDPLVDAWVAVLTDEKVSIEQAKAAAIIVMKTRKYTKMPTPADFLDLIKPRISTKALADNQADLVLEAVRRNGPNKLPAFEDKATAKLMTVRWPWKSFCETLEIEQVKWWRKEFAEAYQDEVEANSPLLLEAPEIIKPLLKSIGEQTE